MTRRSPNHRSRTSSNAKLSSCLDGRSRRGVFRRLLGGLIAGDQVADPKRGRLLLESLEKRQLLAGDMELLFTDGQSLEQPAPAAESAALPVAGQAEGEPAPDLAQFAQDLADAGAQFFGAHWCPACTAQKELFEDGKDDLPFIEVTDSQRMLNAIGQAELIVEFPTWEFPDGTRQTGVLSLETLSQRSGVSIPMSEQPTFETVGPQTVRIGSPLHIPIDAYDPNGGPLTVTVSVDDPTLLDVSVLQNNRSIRIDMVGYGDMVFELFEQRAPRASGRVATLAESGFYDGIIFHRVDGDFVIQGGDPTGTGTSGSNLGSFDDDFHPELQHNREGVLSFAKSSDDTNNSQFFVTEIPTRFLDYNHSVFGQLVEGFDVREAISETSTPESRGAGSSQKPDVDITIESIDVFTDTENSVLMFKALGETGTTGVTITVTDQDGNTHSEQIEVTVSADNANSQPYLDPIATPETTPINTPAQLQLTSVDIEGDAVTYFASSLSSQSNGTVSVDPTSGLVTVTPTNGFSGTINVRVGVEPGPGVIGNSLNDMDTQTVSFLFEGEASTAPTAVDLLASSDSGASDTDNVTNEGSLSFLVSGVSSGATVELVNVANGSVIGTQTATGDTVVITTNNIAALGDDSYSIAARQRIGGDTSSLSPLLTIIYDSTSPDSVVASAKTQANVTRPFQTDLISAEEGSGLTYALTSSPAGATIDTTTGMINWTPNFGQEGAQLFAIELTDLAGNVRTESFTVDVDDAPLAAVKLELTDLSGTPITSIAVGQEFILNFIGVDTRFLESERNGVFSAFADILFDSSLIRPVPGSSIEYLDPFTALQKGAFLNGLIDELGATPSTFVVGGTKLVDTPIARVRMETLSSGSVNIRSEPADDINSEFLLYGIDDKIPADAVEYGSVSLAIGQSFTVANDNFTVAEDSAQRSLDVLANDVVVSGSGTLSVVAVTDPVGATVTLDGGTVNFEPDDDFNGDVIFTYRVSDSGGIQENATVTVTVTPVNDPPQTADDSFTVDTNSSDNELQVLSNDSDPDGDDTLTVTDVSSTTNGGVVEITNSGAAVSYTPPSGFIGTDSFNYTVSDGEAERTESVTVTVAPADNPPTANDDTFTITEDDGEASFDVQSNDTRDADNQAFVIDSVRAPSQGGSARVSSDGTQFFYEPADNFNGTEEVVYTIRDTGGGLATATATFTVNAVNDAPPITDPTVGLNRATGESTVFGLDDLPSNVDSGETLTIESVSTSTPAGGTARIDAATQTILYTLPSDDFTGTDTITFTIADGTGSESNGTITVNVADFTERSIFVGLPSESPIVRVSGVRLNGTNLLGETVDLPVQYDGDTAVFANVLPGTYMVEIPAIPFLQGGDVARQISIESGADDGDTTVDPELGRLKPQFLSIKDFLGSAPRKTILVAVEPGMTDVLSMPTSAVDTIDNPVAELDAAGANLTIRGTTTDETTSETIDVEATLPTLLDPRVQKRGEIDNLVLFKVSVEDDDVSFESSAASSSGAEGESVAPATSSQLVNASSLPTTTASSNVLSVGDARPEGESIVAAATTTADLFVPVSNEAQSRTDATVLALPQGDLWLGSSLSDDQPAKISDTTSVDTAMQSIDSAMQQVASGLTIESEAADSIAEERAQNERVGEDAIDAAIESL